MVTVIITIALVLGGCSGETVSMTNQASAERTITDLAGNTVVIPPADKINNVVIVAPPLVSTYASVVKDTSKLVGIHPISISDANQKMLDMMVPNWKTINTTFLTGYASNTEELLKLKPDIILVYGSAQKEGLENINIPVVDFYINNQVNETWSVEIDKLMREIFALGDDNSLQKEWNKANEKVAAILKQAEDAPRQKGLMLMINTSDKITVRGAGTYGDDWLLKSGLENVAAELKGENIEVTMEQIYKWNPDIIYVFRGVPAAQYLSGSIKGQDWSQVQAFKDRRIYDTPKGMMNWGAPCADSPLMIQWLVSKNFPDMLSNEEFSGIIKEYYSRCCGISLTDELAMSILNPNEKS
ncbi:MAG: ABC transporter substrate-binding protein [Bacteroidales bacterium]|nr:ABC transporter substrate-binding protein [Bacteroidales bacterium]